jgi:hypothetical protein
MTITLQGLTPRQRQIAELLWLTDDSREVEQLCSKDRDARVVRDLIVAQELDSYMEVSDEVKDYLTNRG